jgi:Regulator of ribonuclease activity B
MIAIEMLKEMFANMRETPELDVDGDLLWGYFFTDTNPDKLKPIQNYLVDSGYRFVDLYLTEDGDTFFLHVEKIEHHTPQSLYQRNLELDKLADKYQIDSYDGMDVGPAQ